MSSHYHNYCNDFHSENRTQFDRDLQSMWCPATLVSPKGRSPTRAPSRTTPRSPSPTTRMTTRAPMMTTRSPTRPPSAPVMTTRAPVMTTRAPVMTTRAPTHPRVCPPGYYDKTQGKHHLWACGQNCPGGIKGYGGYTDSVCNCACVPNTSAPVTTRPVSR